MKFKMDFSKAVQIMTEYVISKNRNIIIVGDVNVVASEMDHCDVQKSMKNHNLTDFMDYPPRAWFKQFLFPNGPLIE